MIASVGAVSTNIFKIFTEYRFTRHTYLRRREKEERRERERERKREREIKKERERNRDMYEKY